mgnify:CR=1 FL=1
MIKWDSPRSFCALYANLFHVQVSRVIGCIMHRVLLCVSIALRHLLSLPIILSCVVCACTLRFGTVRTPHLFFNFPLDTSSHSGLWTASSEEVARVRRKLSQGFGGYAGRFRQRRAQTARGVHQGACSSLLSPFVFLCGLVCILCIVRVPENL